MSYIRELKNTVNITRFYNISSVRDKRTAAAWLFRAVGLAGLAVSRYDLMDRVRSTEEGDQSLVLPPDCEEEKLVHECCARDIHMIVLTAEFNANPVLLGVNLRDNSVYITLRKRQPADYAALEKILNLV